MAVEPAGVPDGGAPAGGWPAGGAVPVTAPAWAGSKTNRTRLFLLSAIHKFPDWSTARSWSVLNSAWPAGTGPGSPATRPRPLVFPSPAMVVMVPEGSMRRIRAPVVSVAGSPPSWAT